MLDLIVLAGLTLLALALRAAGRSFHWWVLPGALALHWWLWTGGGRDAAFLGVFATFLVAVFVDAWQLRNPVPRASLPPLAPAVALAGTTAPLALPGRVAPAAANPRASTAEAPPWFGSLTPIAEAPLAPSAAAPAGPGPSRVLVPAAPPRDLLSLLAKAATARQRAELWPQLRAPGELVAAPASAADVTATPGHGPWGREILAGLWLDWDPFLAPAKATVLALRLARRDLGTAAHPPIGFVPTSLEGVKALGGDDGSALQRWAGRGVFLPWHLVVGEESGADEVACDIVPGQFEPPAGR